MILSHAKKSPLRLFILTIRHFIHLFAGAGPSCRFDPVCSSYVQTAIETHGLFRGTLMGLKRLSRCHPWGGYGYDPVVPAGGRN